MAYGFPAAAALALALAPPVTAEQAPAPGPLVVEPFHEGIAFVPENRATHLDGRAGNLAGGFVGFLSDETFSLRLGPL